MPRFPGVVRSVHKRLGDAVARGDLLAMIESNESLQPFELRAPLAGTVIAKDVAPGEFVSTERELFQIADLASVWVDLDVYRRDFGRLRVGQPRAHRRRRRLAARRDARSPTSRRSARRTRRRCSRAPCSRIPIAPGARGSS